MISNSGTVSVSRQFAPCGDFASFSIQRGTTSSWRSKSDFNPSISRGQTLADGINGVTALVSDSLPSGAALLLDASQIMADSGTITLDTARHASIQFETAPDSPATASTVPANLWQHDLVALKAERDYAYSVMRSTAVASLSGVSY